MKLLALYVHVAVEGEEVWHCEEPTACTGSHCAVPRHPPDPRFTMVEGGAGLLVLLLLLLLLLLLSVSWWWRVVPSHCW